MIIRSDLINDRVKELVRCSNSRDLDHILADHEVYLYSRPLQHLLGMYTIVLGSRCILLNNRLSERHRRIVLAHEFGHDQLHRHLVPELGYFTDEQLMASTEITEYEANTFAAHLLVSDRNVKEWLNEGYDEKQMAASAGIPVSLMLIKLQAFSREYELNLSFSQAPNLNYLNKRK